MAHASSIAADAVVDDSALVDDAPRTEDGTGALMDEMRGCKSMHEIMEMIQDADADMSASDVALALYRVAYLSKRSSRAGTTSTPIYQIMELLA